MYLKVNMPNLMVEPEEKNIGILFCFTQFFILLLL
ncbi:UNVERIFIED_CONTAM: hypothetical protein GTU68_007409 [Idotea baltica]|nr:hypothetical protein [Idotea baltica]